MEQFFASGRVADVIAVVMVLEVIALTLYHRAQGRGVTGGEVICNAAAGLGLVLALRAALTGAPWWWTAVFLLAALAGHIADLSIRWRH